VRIEFSYARGPEYFRSLLRPHARRVARRILLAALIWAGLGTASLFAAQGEGWGVFAGFVALVFAVVLPLRAYHSYEDAVAMPTTASAERTYVITDEALESSTDLTSSRWNWAAVRRMRIVPVAYVFWTDGSASFDLPREPLSPEQDAELRALLSARNLLRE
jgi:hypothetical protein